MKLNLVIDVDGVMTTGRFFYSSEGKTHKEFGPHDSDGLKMLKDHMNIQFVTADKRGFPISERRIKDMGYPIELVTEKDRYNFVKERFGFENTIFIGDGIHDAPVLRDCLFGVAPANARDEAKEAANFVTSSKSAEGAVCDACIEIKKRFIDEDLDEGIICIKSGEVEVSVHKGRVCSLKKNGVEFMHGASKSQELQDEDDKKGWSKSEITMFPLIGPAEDYCMRVGSYSAPLDGHGLTRNFSFEIVFHKKNHLKLRQKYLAHSLIKNKKYVKGNGRPEYLSWPFSYVLDKDIEIIENEVHVRLSVENSSDRKMPFMLGWHPAFKFLSNAEGAYFSVESKKHSLNEVLGAPGGVIFVDGKKISFRNNENNLGLDMETKGFSHFMLWSPGREAGMVCIEPVTHLPEVEGNKNYFNEGHCESLKPGERKTYLVQLRCFSSN